MNADGSVHITERIIGCAIKVSIRSDVGFGALPQTDDLSDPYPSAYSYTSTSRTGTEYEVRIRVRVRARSPEAVLKARRVLENVYEDVLAHESVWQGSMCRSKCPSLLYEGIVVGNYLADLDCPASPHRRPS